MWALFITMLYSQVKSVCIMLKYLLLTLNPPKEFWPWLYALAFFAENNVFSNWKQVSQSNFWNIDSRSRESFSHCVNYCWTFLISNDLLRKGCWRKINACYWVADIIDSINADLNIFSQMRLENLDARWCFKVMFSARVRVRKKDFFIVLTEKQQKAPWQRSFKA